MLGYQPFKRVSIDLCRTVQRSLGAQRAVNSRIEKIKLGVTNHGPLGPLGKNGQPISEKEVLQDAIKMGVRVAACAPSADILKNLGVTKDTVVDGVVLEDVIGFLNEAFPAAQKGGVVTFI